MSRSLNKLTDARARSARYEGKVSKLADGGGLYLHIMPTGSKLWHFAYRYDGKQKLKAMGRYPEITLALARERRDEMRAMLAAGKDPSMEIKPEAPVEAMTLQRASETFWTGRKDISPSYRKNAERGIEMHLFPALGKKPIGEITREDLLKELQRMDACGLHVYVRRVRMWVSQVFDWAVENRHAEINPARLIQPAKAFGKSPVENFAALELRDMPEFLARLQMEGEIQSALACRLLGLTWVRTGELRVACWDEIEGDVWRIPAGRMKRRKHHLVPLSRQAQALLEVMRARSRGSVYIFPAEHRLDRPMSENAVLYLLHRMGYKGRMTGHGWRTVASTWANEHGYRHDAIEKQLSHSPEDRIRAVYNRAEYLPERQQMLQEWADWLDSQVDAGSLQG